MPLYILRLMTKPRKKNGRERKGVSERPAKLSELLGALPPLADDAFPDEVPDAPPESIETF
jgi:hypothetical protein